MSEENRVVRLAGSTLNCPCHVCAFFHSSDDEYRVLLPFMKEGFELGHKMYQMVDKDLREERLRRLEEAGVDVATAERSGQLEVLPWEKVHLRGGCFDQYAMLALVEEVLNSGKRRFGLTRFWANMEWALEELPGVHDIVEYEARLNHILPKFGDVVVCTYDVTRFSAALVMDVLRTHPHVIIGGILQENPFYVPPDEFLKELRGRAAQAE